MSSPGERRRGAPCCKDDIIITIVKVDESPAEREEDARLDGLVIDPGGVLDDLLMRRQEQSDSLSEASGAGPEYYIIS